MTRPLSLLVTAVFMLLLSSAQAEAATEGGDARVRFVHAVPSVGVAAFTIDGQSIGEADFGEATELEPVSPGPAELRLTAAGGIELSAKEELEAGRGYTVVVLATKEAAEMRLFENEAAKADLARLRMIHAAPELGAADLAVGGEVVAEDAGYTANTEYMQLEPGDYRLAVQSPASGDAVLADTVPLAAGTAETALVVGSQGKETRVVLVEDDIAAPEGAAETGFGGLAGEGDDSSAPAASELAAALVIATLCLVALMLAARRFGGPSRRT